MRNPRRIAGMTPKGSMTFYNIYNVNGVRYGTGRKGRGLYAFDSEEFLWHCIVSPQEFSLEGIKHKWAKVMYYSRRIPKSNEKVTGATVNGPVTFCSVYDDIHGVRYATGPNGKGLFSYVPSEDRWQCVALPYEFSLEGIKYKRTKVRRYAERRLRENYA